MQPPAELRLDYENARLIRALKLLVYFSVVLPGTFMNYYENDDVFQDIVYSNEEYFNLNRNGKKAQAHLQKFKKNPKWQEKSIQKIEESMDDDFM